MRVGRQGRRPQLLVGRVEFLNGGHDRQVFAEGEGVVLNVPKIGLNLRAFVGAYARELVEDPIGEIDLAASITEGCRQQS